MEKQQGRDENHWVGPSVWDAGRKQEMKTRWKGKLKETVEICEFQATESKFCSVGNRALQKFLSRRDTIKAF